MMQRLEGDIVTPAGVVAGHLELDGARILKPETVKLMRKSVLRHGVGVDLYGAVQKGVGFGMEDDKLELRFELDQMDKKRF